MPPRPPGNLRRTITRSYIRISGRFERLCFQLASYVRTQGCDHIVPYYAGRDTALEGTARIQTLHRPSSIRNPVLTLYSSWWGEKGARGKILMRSGLRFASQHIRGQGQSAERKGHPRRAAYSTCTGSEVRFALTSVPFLSVDAVKEMRSRLSNLPNLPVNQNVCADVLDPSKEDPLLAHDCACSELPRDKRFPL